MIFDLSVHCLGIDLFPDLRDEVREGHRAEIAALTGTDGNDAVFDLFIADDQHIGDLLHLRFADLEADLFIAQVCLDAHTGGVELFCDLITGVVRAVGHGEHLDLHRSEPGRERAGEMLRDNADEALDGAENGSSTPDGTPLLF